MKIIREYKIDILIFLAFLGFTLLLPNNVSIWTDELFTLEFVELSVPESLKETALDIHPPLYYLVVKLFVNLFPFVDMAILGKFVSLFIFFAFLLITYHYIKKYINDSIASTYAIVAMGCKILHYCFEIRMYTLATSLIVLAYISGYLLVTTKKHRFAIYTNICVLLAMYTHYYAVFAILPLFLYLVVSLCKEKEYKVLLLSICFQIVAYLPWLIYFMSLLSNNQSGFGTGYYLSLSNLITYIVVLFSNGNKILTAITMCFYLLIVVIAFKRSRYKDVCFAFICISSVISIFIFGNILGFVFDKFFSGKYLLLGWNTFVFGICLILNDVKCRKQFIVGIIALNVFTYLYAIKDEITDIIETNNFVEFINDQNDVTCIGKYSDLCEYYSENNVLILENNDISITTEYVILNEKIDDLEVDFYSPAQVNMYVYKTSKYNQYVNNLR